MKRANIYFNIAVISFSAGLSSILITHSNNYEIWFPISLISGVMYLFNNKKE